MLTVWRVVAVLLAVLLCGVAYSEQHPTVHPNSKAAESDQYSKAQQYGREDNPFSIKIIPTPDAQAKAANEETYREQKASEDRMTMKATIFLAIVTTVLAFVTGMLWNATRALAEDARNTATQQARDMRASLIIAQQSADAAIKSAEVAEKALTTTAKAIIFNSHIHAVAGLSQKAGMAVVDWTFYIIWKNTGTTPTRHLHMHTNWMSFDTEMPGDFDFPDLSLPPPIRPKIVIGPDATTWSGECVIPIAVLIEASEKKKHIYLWGWVEYNDVFDASTRHRTECCVEIVVVGDPRVAHAPDDTSSHNHPFQYRGGTQFNGMDDECYRQLKKYPPG